MGMGSFVNIVVSLYFWLKSDSTDKLCAKTSKHYWTDVECNLGRSLQGTTTQDTSNAQYTSLTFCNSTAVTATDEVLTGTENV